ncbi:hypothetical protein Pmani_023680 [Petrolisthes manimaculis]|uniref:Uncharacterized protein n=1 Tax=Petrolisthes manimaculis TaxID=1843537 RepID=A0AAE1U013_9EUCA|nr:hypothetical protein Pmani_023680 [Petrolisthes manimaculis]
MQREGTVRYTTRARDDGEKGRTDDEKGRTDDEKGQTDDEERRTDDETNNNKRLDLMERNFYDLHLT